MAYDEGLAERIRERMADRPGVSDKKMFGGLAFLTDGRLTVCVNRDDLMVRVGPEDTGRALAEPGARPMVMGKRTMRGWVLVDGAVLDDDVLTAWIDRATEFVSTLAPD